MPRNVVTLDPRLNLFGRKHKAQERVLAALADRYRFRTVENRVEIDFPKDLGRKAKEQVVAELDRIEPSWRRLFPDLPARLSEVATDPRSDPDPL